MPAWVTGTGGSGGYTFAAGKIKNALTLVKANQGYASIADTGLSAAAEMTVATRVYVNANVAWLCPMDGQVNSRRLLGGLLRHHHGAHADAAEWPVAQPRLTRSPRQQGQALASGEDHNSRVFGLTVKRRWGSAST